MSIHAFVGRRCFVVGALQTINLIDRMPMQQDHQQTTPVGFEPTRGDPIGLAGRRLSRSAKVSLQSWPPIQIARAILQRNERTLSAKIGRKQKMAVKHQVADADAEITRPCGLMDKALVFGTKDCRFESCQGQMHIRAMPQTSSARAKWKKT